MVSGAPLSAADFFRRGFDGVELAFGLSQSDETPAGDFFLVEIRNKEAMMCVIYIVQSSWGNDSVALIQTLADIGLTDALILYNDTGWAHKEWDERVSKLEKWARGFGFKTDRTHSIGLEALVKKKKSWPRQGIQFCTQELKVKATDIYLQKHFRKKFIVRIIGVRRAESKNRSNFPNFKMEEDGSLVWAPMVALSDSERDALLMKAGIDPLPHRSMECFPCINSNRSDLRMLAEDEQRIAHIERIEDEMGFTSNGKPRTMFRPYRHMGATGIREIVRWAMSERGEFDLDDGNGSSGCEAGWCRS